MLTDQVVGYARWPGSGRPLAGVKAAPAPERSGEDLGGQVVGRRAPTRPPMKRCTTAKLTSKHCSKSASPTTGVPSGALASPRLGPFTLNDCQFARHMFPARAKCSIGRPQPATGQQSWDRPRRRPAHHDTRQIRNKVWSQMREFCTQAGPAPTYCWPNDLFRRLFAVSLLRGCETALFHLRVFAEPRTSRTFVVGQC